MNDHTVSANPVEDESQSPQVDVARHPSHAHYYEIADSSGDQRAALTVILNAQMRVLHAELWFYERYRALEPVQAEIYRRAKQIVETNYLGSGFGSELRVLDGNPLDEEIVQHSNPDPRYQPERRVRIWPYVTTYAAIMAVLLLFLLLNRTVLRPTPASVATARNDLTAPQQAAPAASDATIDVAAVQALLDEMEGPMPQAETNGLRPSVMADDRLMVGMTARIRPGYRSFVRSEPGPEAGSPVGSLENGATARLLGGPVWLEGNTDTIVWWYVETADTRGWTPANTSELTLLEPVE